MNATLQRWTAVILVGILFVVVFNLSILVPMNEKYNKNASVGLDTSVLTEFEEKQNEMAEKLKTGKVSWVEKGGLVIITAGGLVTTIATLLWNFISGAWINTITVNYLHFPNVVGIILQILYFFSIGFALLYLIFKVRT